MEDHMPEQSRYEKEEKEEKDEKEMEKHEEKTVEEKWRRDPLGTLIWALILIWAGLVWLGWNLGFLTRFAFLNRLMDNSGHMQPPFIPLILLGAGILILIEIVIRLLVPNYRRSVVGSFIIAAVLIGLGLGDAIKWSIIWPLIIIAIGLIFIIQGFFRKR
jgi:predicted MFS family arabinose efflux permease